MGRNFRDAGDKRVSAPTSSSSLTGPPDTAAGDASSKPGIVSKAGGADRPSRQVTVRVKHGAQEGQGLDVKVSTDATILQVRKAIMNVLQESKLSQVKLVKKLGRAGTGGFATLADGEVLGQRKELIMMGRDLPPRS